VAAKGRGKSDRLRALAFAGDLWGDKADAWVEREDCRIGYRQGAGGVVFRTIVGEGPTFAAAVDEVRARLRREALTYRMQWLDALVTCAVDGTLDRANAGQFVEWCEQRAIEVQRRAI